MSSKHVAGPLTIENVFGNDEEESLDIVLDREVPGEATIIPIAQVYCSDDDCSVPTDQEQARATAKRLVDCYNACEGIANISAFPKVLQSMKSILEMFRREMESDEDMNGSDAVEWLSNWWFEADEVMKNMGSSEQLEASET